MLNDSIKDFYTQAAKKFSKLGSLQTVKQGKRIVFTEKIDANKIKDIMDAPIKNRRLVSVGSLFEENVYPKGSSFLIRKLNDRKILIDKDYDTWICDFDEDIIEEFFGKCQHMPIVFYDEALEKLKAEQKMKRKAAKEKGRTNSGIFEHSYFFDSNSTEKKTLSKIIKDANGKKLLWKICRSNDVPYVISQFEKLREMFSFLNKEFNYELVATRQSVWNNNRKKFPDTGNSYDTVFEETKAEYAKKLDGTVCYSDMPDWIMHKLKDFTLDRVKNRISEIHNKKIEKYIIKLIENYTTIQSLPCKAPSLKMKKLCDEPEFECIVKNYEMIDFSDFLYYIINDSHSLQLEKDIRYINLVDDYRALALNGEHSL